MDIEVPVPMSRHFAYLQTIVNQPERNFFESMRNTQIRQSAHLQMRFDLLNAAKQASLNALLDAERNQVGNKCMILVHDIISGHQTARNLDAR